MNEPKHPLEHFHPPEPPADLRERVLTAAGEAPDDSWIDRLWNNRRLRQAWLLATTLLMMLEVMGVPRYPLAENASTTSEPTRADWVEGQNEAESFALELEKRAKLLTHQTAKPTRLPLAIEELV
jgi:hypothetical protein